MKELCQKQINKVSGGIDYNALYASVGGGVVGAGCQWYRNADLLSSQSVMWGLGGAALGAVGYYAAGYVLDYMSS